MNYLKLKNCKIVDVISGKINNGNIYIIDGKIVHIGENYNNDISFKEVDINNQYVIPGLINLHVHLFGSGKPSKTLGGGRSQERLIKFVHTKLGRVVLNMLVSSAAKQELFSGVTTVRSVGDFLYSDVIVRNKINAGKIIGSRILCSGPAITVPGGHGDGTFSVTSATEEGLRELVRKNAEKKVDLIKICVTGGVMDAKKKGEPGEVKMSLEQTSWVCDEAHKLGFKVASHTESPKGIEIAIRGGVDTIEHGATFNEEDAKILKKRNGAVIPTFTPALPLAKLDPSITKLHELARFNTQIVLDNMQLGALEAYNHQISVGMGTDASCPLCTQYGMYRELIYHTKCLSSSNLDALRTATIINANILGMDDKIGSIENGKFADMVVLKENPLEDLITLKEPVMVIKEGKVYTKKPKRNKKVDIELDKILEEIR